MVKSEFSFTEISWIMVSIEKMIEYGGDVYQMRDLVDLYFKLDGYRGKLVEENSVND